MLRRLRFPLNGATDADPEVDTAARTALAALGLAAATLAQSEMTDLRSRCQLFPQSQTRWELLDVPGKPPKHFELTPETAVGLLNTAVSEAKAARLPWEGVIQLTPSDELIELVRRSQELVVTSGSDDE